jgi:anti-sigma B factor antagonist
MSRLPRLVPVTAPAEFEVTVEQLEQGGTVVRVRGEVDMATCAELQAALDRAGRGEPVIVDLTDCAFLDSSAIRVLLMSSAKAESTGGSASLVVPDARIRRVLEIAGLDTRLPIHPNLEAAVLEAAG